MDDPTIIGTTVGAIVVVILILAIWALERDNLKFIDSTYYNEFEHLQNMPHCPDCGSYHLKLIDNCDGLPWLKGHVQEIDYFECQKCRKVFNDEDWKDAKHFDNAPAEDD